MDLRFHDSREFQHWVLRLSTRDKANVTRAIQELAIATRPIPMPHGRRIDGDLHELRPSSGRSSIRIYYRYEGSTAVILTTGRKDTQQRNIDRARGRMRP
jgi:putative addiction module killer protein